MNWLSRILCRIGVHKWEYGPGECCSSCGVADRVWDHAVEGRIAINPKTGESQFFPEDWDTLPDGWRWF